jgi:phage antirepressor YoqD-like protein
MNTKEFDHLVNKCDCVTLTMGEAANILGIGRNRFMLLLREMGLLLKANRPAETMRKLGYMELQMKEHPGGNRVKQCSPVPMITLSGLAYVSRKLQKDCRKAREQNEQGGNFKEVN